MNIFSSRAGRVVLVPEVGLPLAINVQGWPGALGLKSVVTQFGLAAGGNFQFLHTLRNFVYVYVFGERIAEVTIGGLAFPGDCDFGPETGIERLWRFWQQNKISAKGTPVGLAVGTTMSFEGFLVGFNVGLTDPQYGLAQWAMKLNFFPPEN